MYIVKEPDLISIIVPVYNVQDYLPHCLDTIARQTYRNLEIILVDDGSTDGSSAICDEFVKQDRRAVVIHQQNQGLWAARNTGKRKAHGKFLMFVDSDDYIHLDSVRTLYLAICHNEEYVFSVADFKPTHSYEKDSVLDKRAEQIEITQDELVSDILFHDRQNCPLAPVWNKLYRTDKVADIWFENYFRAEDYDFNIRVSLQTEKAIYIKQTLYYWFHRQDSLTHLPVHLINHYQCVLMIYKNNIKNLSDEKKQYRHLLLKKMYRRMAYIRAQTYKSGDAEIIDSLCKENKKLTIRMYLKESNISILERLGILFLIHSPWLTRWMMKRTKNL